MIYETYLKNSENLKKEILFNGKIKTLGWILKTHKDYFNKKPNFLSGINSSSKIITSSISDCVKSSSNSEPISLE